LLGMFREMPERHQLAARNTGRENLQNLFIIPLFDELLKRCVAAICDSKIFVL
jgi:hypothetical protein